MSKGSIIAYAILLLLLVIVGQQFYYEQKLYSGKIAEAKENAKKLEAEKKELQKNVAILEKRQGEKQKEIDQKSDEIAELREDIKKIEAAHAVEMAKTYRITDDDQTVKIFKKKFKEMEFGIRTIEGWEVAIVDGEEIPVPVNYIRMPVAYTEHFIRLDEKVITLEKENKKLSEIDDRSQEVIDLQKQVLKLETQKKEEYVKGYETAYTLFETTNDRYIKTMKENRSTDLIKTIGAFVGGIALGVNF